MEKKLPEIRRVINDEIDRRNNLSEAMGERTNYAADELENELSWFAIGISTAIDAIVEREHQMDMLNNTSFEVPDNWKKFFIKEDPEYKEYLRLKSKFENE